MRHLKEVLRRHHVSQVLTFILSVVPCGHLFAIDFAGDVLPILQTHCLRCHSPNNSKGDLSLATYADLEQNEYVVPGDPDASYLIDLVTSAGGDPPEMPQESEPLSDKEVSVLRDWISAGASWPDDIVIREKSAADETWWAYQPLASNHGASTIDDFVRSELAEHDLAMNPRADRRTLIRRATYDLTGLPPTPEEAEAFANDSDPLAYPKLIDRLLASPHYGERWGRHWLDVVRFGESNGFERNVIINDLWPFRDYVIRSINDDKPFDQFMREHIAGDVIAKDSPDVAVATAFLVAGPYDDVNNQDPVQAAQIRANTLDEIISATSGAFLGMTLGCARCHDHKFDPITQEDYYGLYATFAGIRHGRAPLATQAQRSERAAKTKPLTSRQAELNRQLQAWTKDILARGRKRIEEHSKNWTRPPVDRQGTIEEFAPVEAKFVRLLCDANDINPDGKLFRMDEFEIWSAGENSVNVALQSNGGKASGKARVIEDFPGAYGPQHVNDGNSGARFIATSPQITLELAEPTLIERVVFSSARGESTPGHTKFSFVAEYRIEVSPDGRSWIEVANGRDRKPNDKPLSGARPRAGMDAPFSHQDHRLLAAEATAEDHQRKTSIERELNQIRRGLAQIPPLPQVWIGTRNEKDATGPFHIFLGGSPQKKGDEIVPASLSVLKKSAAYKLSPDSPESQRRNRLADWIVDPSNPLTPRVLANRLWHYHFGTGIVDTPSDFGFMGGRPSHPELLDFLAIKLQENRWQLKPMHRMIMLSDAYRQSSTYQPKAADIDGDARLLWRFPPRRLSAEEVRDTILSVSGVLDTRQGGPGFRLYRFMQDNVCTYVPLDRHDQSTYRRAVYHQNARASVVDLMTDFDQPDCAFAAPKRAETTTPLQALTMLNHSFTLDMAEALRSRLKSEAGDLPEAQIRLAYQLCYQRLPNEAELADCRELIQHHSLTALCRVLLNTSELIYVQ